LAAAYGATTLARMTWGARFRGLVFIAGLLPGFTGAAWAQIVQPPAQPQPTAVTAEDLQSLVDTIQDPAARQKLIKELQGLIAAQRGVQQASPAANVRSFFAGLSQQADALSGEVLVAAAVVVDAPRLLDWFQSQISNQETRRRWIEVTTKLIIVFGLALAADWLFWFLLRGVARRLDGRHSETIVQRLFLVLIGLVLEAVPIAIFASVAFFVLPLTKPNFATMSVAKTVIVAYLWSRGISAAARVLLLSNNAMALYPLGEETRNYLYIWVRRFTNLAVYGFAIAGCAWWLSAPGAIYAILLRIVVLVLGVLSIVFVLQNRGAVTAWLRGNKEAATRRRGWALLRAQLAESWHILAIVYIFGVFGVYTLHIEGGFVSLLRATVLSVVIVLAAALAAQFVGRASERGFAIKPELQTRFPTLEARANRYLPALTKLVATAIYVVAALALLQAWGLRAFAWFQDVASSRIAGSIAGIIVVLTGALIAWEMFGALLERYMQRLKTDSRRHARANTMFPFLRLVVLAVLGVIVVFAVLGELGINVSALLAGAGVFGLVAGIGSQSVIKDLTTSVAVLVDDTFAVGDVIDAGGGHSGMVEKMSMRTVKLRGFDGALMTVPFSEMKIIQNLTKDYSYYVADVGVAYKEDTDRVAAVLSAVAEEMRHDKQFAPYMLEPLEVVGVDRFEDSAVIVKVRLKTLPIRQWAIGREFNRRLKQAFDREGIEIPFPHRTIFFGNADGDAAKAGEKRLAPKAG
jgi:moderate conductance mechanosensitive channel